MSRERRDSSQLTPPRTSLPVCSKCGEISSSHTALTCTTVSLALLPPLDPTPPGPCTRCGRWNHRPPQCTASLKRILAYARKTGFVVCGFCEDPGHTIEDCPRTKPSSISSTFAAEAPPMQRRVANIMGTKLDNPPAGSSWILELVKINGAVKVCVALGCSNAAEEGAHVWLEGERRFHFIAPFCRSCNHRHGGEEICHCRYVQRGEDPISWIAIKDSWLYKVTGKYAMEALEIYCREKGGHGFRLQCCGNCPLHVGAAKRRRGVEGGEEEGQAVMGLLQKL